MSELSYDVLVVGGGVVGLTAALAMAQLAYKVAIIDAKAFPDATLSPKNDARVYALNHASIHLLQQLGVSLDAARCSPYKHMDIWDTQHSEHLHFDASLIAKQDLGLILEESVIKQGLMQQLLKESTVDFFPHQPVKKVAEAELWSDTHHWQGRLLIIADGRGSTVREALGVQTTHWPYHQEAVVATIETTLPHEQTAYQVFSPEGVLALLPLANSKHCSIVWSTTATKAQSLKTMEPAIFSQTLSKAIDARLGDLTLLSERHHFPLAMTHTQQYVGSNWLLMGDAAHTIHPLAGLGLNIGLADVRAWRDKVSEHRLVSKALLQAYQRQRKADLYKTIVLMDAIKAIYLNPLKPVVLLRQLGMRCINQLNPLKQFMIQQMEI